MIKIKNILIIYLLFAFQLLLKAQDLQLSQFYSLQTYLGPSFAGATDGSRAVINFRDQWPGMNRAFITYALSYDRNFPKFKSGAGFLAISDRSGEIKLSRTLIGLQYCYQIKINHRWVFRPGLTFYYLRTDFDMEEITFGHQINTTTGEITGFSRPGLLKDAKNSFDFTSSVLLYHSNYWIGLTLDHLVRPNESLSQQKSIIPLKITTYGGYKYDFNQDKIGRPKERSVTIAYFYKKQNKFKQFDIGGYWTREPLTFGLWYRGIPIQKNIENYDAINHDAIIFLAGLKLEQFQFSYNYDITISKMYTNSHGAHEISIIYLMPYKEPKRRIKPLPCPWF